MADPIDSCNDSAHLAHQRRAAHTAGLSIDRFVVADDRDAVIDGIRLHYLDWGGPEQHPVVFLHGGGLNARTWDLICLALRDRFRCIALDLRGHGDSEWSPTMAYSIADHARDVIGLADHLGFDEFALIGMSLGGMAAMGMAGSHPERLSALAIVDVGTEIRLGPAQRIRRFMTEASLFGSIDEVIDRAITFNPRRDRELLRHSLLHNLRRLSDGSWAWKHDSRHRADPETLDALRAEVSGLAAGFGGVRCPVLIVRGEESEVFLEGDAHHLAGSFEHGRVVEIPDAGHTVQGDNPAALVKALEAFLSGLPA